MKKQKSFLLKKLLLSTVGIGTVFLYSTGFVHAQTPPKPPVAIKNVATPTTPAVEAEKPKQEVFTGRTLDKIQKENKIVIANRSSSIPISFYDENKKPIGYGVDICMDFVNKLKVAYNLPNLQVEFLEVTSSNRIPLVVAGKVDLECGSTTNNASRRKEVSFSVPYYVAGVRILVGTKSGIKGLKDLKNKTVVVSKGTSTQKTLNAIKEDLSMSFKIIEAADFPSSLQEVVKGNADAFVLDDILLFSERSKIEKPQEYEVVGEFLSIEPLAIMVRNNDLEFKNLVDKYMIDIITSGKINEHYKKWFESPIPPTNKSLDIPQSPLLKDLFRMPTASVGN
jgi:glutamate/aspartate transport system substrate-binding protein